MQTGKGYYNNNLHVSLESSWENMSEGRTPTSYTIVFNYDDNNNISKKVKKRKQNK